MKVKIKKLSENAVIPQYAKPGDAGMDVTATSINITDKYIEYGTGLAFEVPEGYVMFIFPRSSVSKYDLSLANAVGVLDSGYRGELKLRFKRNYNIKHLGDNKILEKSAFEHNISPTEILICDKIYDVGDKIGQIIIIPYPHVEFEESVELSETERGTGGFGSTSK